MKNIRFGKDNLLCKIFPKKRTKRNIFKIFGSKEKNSKNDKIKTIVSVCLGIITIGTTILPETKNYTLNNKLETLTKQEIIGNRLDNVKKTAELEITSIKHICLLKSSTISYLQFLLVQHSYEIDIDGICGFKTKTAFADFKIKNYLAKENDPDIFLIGPSTFEKLQELNLAIKNTVTIKLATTKNQFISPADGILTSPFGYRIHPISGKFQHHNGVDIGNKVGTTIKSSQNGKVTYVGWLQGYGKTIIVSSGNVKTYYAHLDQFSVQIDQLVKQGQKIGEMGTTGYSTGSHLHFEIRINGKPVNPLKYFKVSTHKA